MKADSLGDTGCVAAAVGTQHGLHVRPGVRESVRTLSVWVTDSRAGHEIRDGAAFM
jgi:hypothetical protein